MHAMHQGIRKTWIVENGQLTADSHDCITTHRPSHAQASFPTSHTVLSIFGQSKQFNWRLTNCSAHRVVCGVPITAKWLVETGEIPLPMPSVKITQMALSLHAFGDANFGTGRSILWKFSIFLQHETNLKKIFFLQRHNAGTHGCEELKGSGKRGCLFTRTPSDQAVVVNDAIVHCPLSRFFEYPMHHW
jgi:hypothetical protein